MEYCKWGDLAGYIKRKGLIEPIVGVKDANASKLGFLENPLGGSLGGLNENITRHFLKQLGKRLGVN